MSKHKKKHRKLHRLTPEQKAKRKARMKKLLHIMLWLNPVSATVMAHKLIAEKIKARRAAKKANAQEVVIIDELQNNISAQADQATNTGGEQPGVVGQPSNTVEEISQQLSESTNDSAVAEEVMAEGDDLNDTGDAARMKSAFETAKKKAGMLTGAAKDETLATIAELEKALNDKFKSAKMEVGHADKADVAQAKAALKGANFGKIANSTTTTEVAPVGKADKEEQLATGITPTGVPMWAYYALGGVAVLALTYYAYTHFSKEKK